MRTLTLIACALLLATMAGCPDVPPSGDADRSFSEAVTARYYQFSIFESRLETVAFLTITENAESPIRLLLADGASIRVNDTLLERDERTRYSATLERADNYRVLLELPEDGPFETTIEAPNPVVLLTPQDRALVSRQAGFPVRWRRSSLEPDVQYDLLFERGIECGGFVYIEDVQHGQYNLTRSQLDICGQSILRGLLHIDAHREGDMPSGLRGTLTSTVRTTAVVIMDP